MAKTTAAEKDKAPAAEKPELPETVTLAAPYGYIDDEEKHRYWHTDTVVTNPDDIADLMARKAPLVGIEHAE